MSYGIDKRLIAFSWIYHIYFEWTNIVRHLLVIQTTFCYRTPEVVFLAGAHNCKVPAAKRKALVRPPLYNS